MSPAQSRSDYLQAQLRDSTLVVRILGRWVVDNVTGLERTLLSFVPDQVTLIELDAEGVSEIDLTGAALLHGFARRLAQRATVRWKGPVPDQVLFVERTLSGETAAAAPGEQGFDLAEPVRTIGRWAVQQAQSFLRSIAFFGRICAALGRALLHIRHLRVPALARHVHESGVHAIPIVSLIAFLISVIVAYMGAQQLRRFGAEIFVVDLVTIGVLREMGVLLTAIIVAGRSGSAFAAEIGVMRLNEEVDALQAIGTDPVEVLVLPRVLGLMIAMPLLTIIADAVGLVGGGLLCRWLLDIPLAQYLARVQESIAPTTFWVGVIKAPVFAFLIAFVGTLRGMQVRGSSRELGRLTTVAVVQSIFLVILADAVFAVVFMELDI